MISTSKVHLCMIVTDLPLLFQFNLLYLWFLEVVWCSYHSVQNQWCLTWSIPLYYSIWLEFISFTTARGRGAALSQARLSCRRQQRRAGDDPATRGRRSPLMQRWMVGLFDHGNNLCGFIWKVGCVDGWWVVGIMCEVFRHEIHQL